MEKPGREYPIKNVHPLTKINKQFITDGYPTPNFIKNKKEIFQTEISKIFPILGFVTSNNI